MSVMARFGRLQPVEMLHVKALHLADNRPYIFEDSWVDVRSTPDILKVDLKVESANKWLVRNKPYSRLDLRECQGRACKAPVHEGRQWAAGD